MTLLDGALSGDRLGGDRDANCSQATAVAIVVASDHAGRGRGES